MADLTGFVYNTGALTYHVYYRVIGTSGPWLDGGIITADPSPAIKTAFTISDVAPNQYEYYFSSICTGDIPSVNSNTFYTDPACPVPLSFNVNLSGSNFIVSYTVPGNVGLLNLFVQYPNGGTLSQNYSVTPAGTITIPVPSGQYGDYTFQIRSVCNETSPWFSAFINTVIITTTNPSPCTPPEIIDDVKTASSPAADTYRFTMGGYTPSVRVVINNNTTGTQQILTQVIVDNYFDISLIRGTIDYNYTVQVFNLCTIGIDSVGDSVNIIVPVTVAIVSTAGWTITAGPDNMDLNNDGIFGTMVTVTTAGITPSTTRTTNVVVRFDCSTSGFAYVNVSIAPNATSGTTRDWNSECTIDTTSGFLNSAELL
jgi:hypothetical protein